jgi:hypothetical protein
MRNDIDYFPEAKQRWKWRPRRWTVGLLSFWGTNIILMSRYPNDISFIFILLLLFMIFGVLTYREGYQSLDAYRIWLLGGLFLSGLLFLGINYLTKIMLINLAPSVSVVMIKQIIALIAVTPFVIWAMRMSKHFVEPKEQERNHDS